jgi:hypothetical protein
LVAVLQILIWEEQYETKARAAGYYNVRSMFQQHNPTPSAPALRRTSASGLHEDSWLLLMWQCFQLRKEYYNYSLQLMHIPSTWLR